HTSRTSGLWPLAAARVATIALVTVFALVARRPLRPRVQGLPVMLLSGALDMGANIAFLLAARAGLLTITAVITSLYPGPTVILAMIVFREKLTVPRALGLVLALAGVACISV
ncbi:MAG TPA: EamA family transporter, partial [bacterium]|nr:EamA family transporter [bacterium]